MEKFLIYFVTCAAYSAGVQAFPNGAINSTFSQLRIDPEDVSADQRAVSGMEIHPRSDDIHYPIVEIDYAHVQMPFVISVWILVSNIAKIAFHCIPKISKIFPESCMLIVIGVIIGVLLRFGFKLGIMPLTSNIFFLYMLPPIIFDAGYFMPNRLFFDNLGTILLMAVLGTIFNIFSIGGTLWGFGLTGLYGEENTPNFVAILLFTSVIAATDPVAVLAVFEEIHVNELLYIIVFGEALLNDAVTVVMYNAMEVYETIGVDNIEAVDIASGVASFFVASLGGTIIGIIWGFLTGFVTRFTNKVLIVEPIFVFVMAYIAYLNAEMLSMSSILAITFCGITMKNYVESNVAENSKITIRNALKMFSNTSETVIFILLGVATIQSRHVWNFWFIFIAIVSCTVFRIISVTVLIAISNRFRIQKVTAGDQIIMSFGGLRGAVAFALVLLIDEKLVKQKDMFVTTTIVIILFTVFLQGILVKPVLKLLNVRLNTKQEMTIIERISERFTDYLLVGMDDIMGTSSDYNLRIKFRRFNKRFIDPLLLRDLKQSERKLLASHGELILKDALDLVNTVTANGSRITLYAGKGYESAISLTNLIRRNNASFASLGKINPAFTTDVSTTNLKSNGDLFLHNIEVKITKPEEFSSNPSPNELKHRKKKRLNSI